MIGGSTVLIGLVVAGVVVTQPAEREAKSGCLKDHKAPEQHVVVVDRTETWTPADRKLLADALHAFSEATQVEHRLTVIPFDGRDGVVGEPLFDRCRPPVGKQVSAAVASPARADRIFKSEFAEPLAATLSNLTTVVGGDQSPITSFISNLAASLRYQAKAESLSLHVFSDMGEHTTAGTLLNGRRKPFNTAGFKAHVKELIGERLKGVRLEIRVVPTPSTKGVVAKRISEGWQAALGAVGVDFVWKAL